jgi:hypothetical protein
MIVRGRLARGLGKSQMQRIAERAEFGEFTPNDARITSATAQRHERSRDTPSTEPADCFFQDVKEQAHEGRIEHSRSRDQFQQRFLATRKIVVSDSSNRKFRSKRSKSCSQSVLPIASIPCCGSPIGILVA